ncbi:MAG: putative O-glycosylation ligase, exosortase A system-associated [Massilia sp.]
MRDAIVFLCVFGLLPFALKRPVIGVFLFTWVSLMNPHRLAYGAAFDFPFAAVIVVVTLFGMLISREPKRVPITPLTVVLILFMCWMTLTGLSAFEPERAWGEWNRVFKTFFMVLVTLAVINSEKDIKAFAWVVGLSLGFYGFKGGLFTLLSGGSSRVLGPAGSYIEDNNDLALALIMTVPLIWYLQSRATKKWMRYGLMALALLTLTAAAGSYSRGALLAGSAMLFFLWLKSQNKARTGVALLLIVPLLYLVMPEQWFSRMNTIDDYHSDGSAMGRINSWSFATNLALDNLMGGGYLTFTPRMFQRYAPDPLGVHAPHSIYFQVLGEHGFIGLALFLTFLFLAWRTAGRVIKYCKGQPELKWAADLSAMCQVSLIGYIVGGAFLSLAYFDLFYDIVALPLLLEKLLMFKKTGTLPRQKVAPPLPARARGPSR